MSTRSISTKWVIEVYPFDSSVPTSSDFSTPKSLLGKAGSIVGSKSAEGAVGKLLDRGTLSSSNNIRNFGVVSVQFSRSKQAPDSNCEIKMVGPLPPDMIPGSWVVISTVSKPLGGETKFLTRFFGQIFAIEPNFESRDDGLLTTTSTIRVREWSYALKVPVKYDILALESQVSAQSFQALAASKLLKSVDGANPSKDLVTLLSKAFDPYELGHLVLQMIGAINEGDIIPSAKSGPAIKLPGLAVTMPSMPPAILSRIGIPDANPKNPFSSGLVKVITGVLPESVYNRGDWNGIWINTNLDQFAQKMKKGYDNLTIRPKVIGLGTLLQAGSPAWDILTRQTENSLNECFTDIWFEKDGNGVYSGKPVLVIRDKPYLLKSLRDNPPPEISTQLGGTPDLSKFSLYDDVPRINIPTDQIISVRLNNNCVNSPNYIRAQYDIAGLGDRFQDAKAALAGIVKLQNEMERFGGNYEVVRTSFFGQNLQRDSNTAQLTPNVTTDFFTDYFGVLRGLFTLWHSYDYRMANGVMMLKDDNIPISVGLNVQFKLGEYDLVAHVESVQYQYSIDESGLESTNCYITFSRLVKVEEDNSLGFIPPEHFGSVPFQKPVKGSVTTGSVINNITSNLTNLGKKVTGFFA